MDKLKQWVALTVVGCLGILAAGWFLLVSPKKSEAEDLKAQAASQEQTNASLRTKLAQLKAQAKDLPKQQAKLAAVAAKIPENPALPALIRFLDSASAEAGVELLSIAPGQPAAVAPAAAAPGAAPAAPAAAPAAPAAPGAAPAPASAAGSLASIPLAINVVGGYFEVQQFMSSLENLPRALRVTALTLAPGANPVAKTKSETAETDGKSLTATITGQVFMAAGAAAAAAPTAPAAPGAPAAAPVAAAPAPAAPAK